MAKKTTKAQRVLRIRAIYELLLTDTPRGDIIRYCYEKWGVSSKTVDNYLQSASVLVIEQAVEMQQNALEKHLAQRALIRHKALKKGDERLAFDVLKDETKLLGLYAPTRLEHTGPEGGPVQTVGYTIEEWRDEQDRRLAEVKKMMAGFDDAKSDQDAKD